MQRKDFNYYVSLPYKIVLYPATEGGYVVEIPNLPGCISQGDDLEDAYKMIEDAKRAWIDIALQEGRVIPEPASEEYSGKFNVRVPKSLHKTLVEQASEEGVSLNQYVLYQLSRSTGSTAQQQE